MSDRLTKANRARGYRWLLALALLGGGGAASALWTQAHPAAISLAVVNHSNWEIRHLYLAPADSDNWGPDQLNEQVLGPGGSVVLANVSCAGAEIKVISEDSGGCFLTHVVACAPNATWTISNEATPDCGD